MKFSRKQFFDSYRKVFGPLQQLQVEGLEFLLGKVEQDPEWNSLPQIAYFMATIKHETGVSRNRVDQTYQPIKELREKAGTARRRNQDRYWISGYYGRGYTQLTWKDNYAKFGLADVPDDALQPDTAYMVAARGIREGKFTKFKLADFINDQEVDYFNARRVVNGLDKAEKIAEEAQKFERILRASLVTDSVTDEVKRKAEEELQQKGPEEPEVEAQEPAPPAAPHAPKPEVTPVEAPPTSITTKIAAGVSAVAPVLTAAGIKIGGIELSTAGVVALSAVVIVGMVLGAWIWNQAQERRERRQRLSMEHLASDLKSNVIAAGSKV